MTKKSSKPKTPHKAEKPKRLVAGQKAAPQGEGAAPANSGPKRLTMEDIGRLAKVSASTVSRALAGSSLIPKPMRDRVNRIARENGYVINQAARSLRMAKTNIVSIVLPLGHEEGQAITDPFLLEMIGHLSQAIMAKGHEVLLTRVSQTRSGWMNTLVSSNRVDGVLIIGQSTEHDAINEVAATYRPLVVWGQKMPDQVYCSVGLDNVAGGEMATRHLLQTGRTHIRFMGLLGVPEFDARYEGYVNAMRERFRDIPEERLKPIPAHNTHAGAREAMLELMASGEKVDAIFAASDVIAHGAKRVFVEGGGKVPDGCAFVGFDDVTMAQYLEPPLTTIRQPLAEAASAMTDLLFRRMAGEDAGSVVIEPYLIIRGTTGPAKA